MAKKRDQQEKKHRTRFRWSWAGRGSQRVGAPGPPQGERTLAATTTGEIYQPIRMHYAVLDLGRVIKSFEALRCVEFDASQNRWVWLYTVEASHIRFQRKPEVETPIVLGSWLKKGMNEMVLDLRSIERAIEAIRFFDKHIPRTAAKVTDVSMVNQLFDIQESTSSTFDHFFDRKTAVRKDPESLLQELGRLGAQGRDEKEKQSLLWAHLEAKAREPLPEIERMPTNFYEDGISSLQFKLTARQAIAMQHWLGNTGYTYADYIQEIMREPR